MVSECSSGVFFVLTNGDPPLFALLPPSHGAEVAEPSGTGAVVSAVPWAAAPIITSPFIIQGRSGKEAQRPDYHYTPWSPHSAQVVFVPAVTTMVHPPPALPISPVLVLQLQDTHEALGLRKAQNLTPASPTYVKC